MSKIDDLIQELCPDGVPFQKINDVSVARKGKWIKSSNLTPGDVPVITSAQESLYTHNVANSTGKVVVVASSGAYAGFISYFDTPIYLSNVFAFDVDKSKIDAKFLYYALKSRQQEVHDMKSGGGVPNVYAKDVGRLKIPIPPLEVQKEIINILDKFTQLEAELSVELEARRKQYEYYRDELINSSNSSSRKTTLGEIMTIARGASPRPIQRFITNESDGVSWIKIGDVQTSAKYITKTAQRITQEGANKSRYVSKGDFILSNSMSFGRPYILGIDGCIHDGWIMMSSFDDNVTSDYLYHLLNSVSVQKYWKQKANSGGAIQNLNSDIVRSTPIYLPSINNQKHIASLLDKFDKFTSDITEGLPAEIEARRKQYEYYRTKLLTFQELSA